MNNINNNQQVFSIAQNISYLKIVTKVNHYYECRIELNDGPSFNKVLFTSQEVFKIINAIGPQKTVGITKFQLNDQETENLNLSVNEIFENLMEHAVVPIERKFCRDKILKDAWIYSQGEGSLYGEIKKCINDLEFQNEPLEFIKTHLNTLRNIKIKYFFMGFFSDIKAALDANNYPDINNNINEKIQFLKIGKYKGFPDNTYDCTFQLEECRRKICLSAQDIFIISNVVEQKKIIGLSHFQSRWDLNVKNADQIFEEKVLSHVIPSREKICDINKLLDNAWEYSRGDGKLYREIKYHINCKEFEEKPLVYIVELIENVIDERVSDLKKYHEQLQGYIKKISDFLDAPENPIEGNGREYFILRLEQKKELLLEEKKELPLMEKMREFFSQYIPPRFPLHLNN